MTTCRTCASLLAARDRATAKHDDIAAELYATLLTAHRYHTCVNRDHWRGTMAAEVRG